mmetsp:Transcript_147599/g.472144  ORF Transcript_147599/g.472144 Transcript_147599/m.472144 type:complete len:198 (+) Transcript_147599:212-805(+)
MLWLEYSRQFPLGPQGHGSRAGEQLLSSSVGLSGRPDVPRSHLVGGPVALAMAAVFRLGRHTSGAPLFRAVCPLPRAFPNAGRASFVSHAGPVFCRVSRFRVFDEAAAKRADEMCRAFKLEVLETVPGFIGFDRRVNPETWEYEIQINFESLAALEDFMAGDAYALETLPLLAEVLKQCAHGGAKGAHRQTFLQDEI